VKNGDINIYMAYKNPVSNMMNSKTKMKKRTSSWEENKKRPRVSNAG